MDPAAKYTPTPPATRITTNPTTTWRTPNRTTTARHDRTNQPKRSPLTTTQCPADTHPFGTPRHERPTREPASTQDRTVPEAYTESHISRTRPGPETPLLHGCNQILTVRKKRRTDASERTRELPRDPG